MPTRPTAPRRRAARADAGAPPAATTGPPRRRAILDAALRVVARDGAEALTHRRVAEEAAVPLGSTTYYFVSRDEMLREALGHHAAAAMALLAEVAAQHTPRSVAELVASLVAMVEHEFEEPSRVLVEYEFILRAARDADLARRLHDYERALVGRLAHSLEALGAPKPFDLARTLVALIRAFELERLTRPDADLDALRARLLSVAAALLPTPKATARSRRPTASRGTNR
jgi:DNA-binding transcriptional regulator YbjK